MTEVTSHTHTHTHTHTMLNVNYISTKGAEWGEEPTHISVSRE